MSQPFDWLIRIHPMMLQPRNRESILAIMEDEFSDLNYVEWENCTNLPLPVVLAQVDLHMTYESAVTIEAGWFGIKTALLSKNVNLLTEWFIDEIRSGTAEIVVDNDEHISAWINNNQNPVLGQMKQIMNTKSLDDFIDGVCRLI